jgi:hypothetical protein
MFRSLLRSRLGLWILLGEALVLAALMVILWESWRGLSPKLGDLARTFFIALAAALLVVYLLPAVAFIGGAVGLELVRAVISKVKASRSDRH